MASVFSGSAGRKSAVYTEQAAQNQMKQLMQYYQAGNDQAAHALEAGFNPSLEALQQAYAQQRADYTQGTTGVQPTLQGGLDTARADINQGYSGALGSLDKYYGKSADALQQSADVYNPLLQKANTGYDMYLNSLGLNGAQGNQAAQGAFQAGPGYQYQVDEATKNAQRGANKLGMAYSGNTIDATTRLASNLANQEYGSWRDKLAGFQGAAQNATAGQSGALANLGQMYGNQAGATAGLQQGQGRDLAGLTKDITGAMANAQQQGGQYLGNAAQQYGENMANLNTGYGQGQANLALGNAQNMAGAISNYYQTVIPAGQQGMMAGQQAAQNRMGALMGGLQMGGQLLGGIAGLPMAGGGSLGGSLLGGLFK